MAINQQGQFLQADFFDNTGGINVSDSPFRVLDTQSTGGQNFEYALTGGVRKIKGATLVNDVADTRLRSVFLGQHVTGAGTKTTIRCADRKIQALDLGVPSFTNLTEDTVSAGSDFLASSNTIPVVGSQFNTVSTNILWLAGGGMSSLYGAYSSTKVTKNGADVATGSFTATASATGGSFTSTGTYYYAIALIKAGTDAVSNAALDVSATISATTDKVTLNFSGLTSLDTTKYDTIRIYRSAVNGVTSFTTGDVVTEIASSTSSYVDTGTSSLSSQNVPRANSTVLDNSVLPSGTYKTVTVWKRRLVTCSGSSIYISDVNKSESWPTQNYLTIPSGGPITALAVISFTTPTSTSIDEILVLFKERELWVVTGTNSSDFALKFIDSVGCLSQSLIAYANGYLSWLDYRGIYLWDGSGKPIYCSRPIETIFAVDGDIDKTKLYYGICYFKRESSEVHWIVSSLISGDNKLRIKMDLRLTLPQVTATLGGRILDSVLITDVLNRSYFAGASLVPSTDEVILCGDDAGFIYEDFTAFNDASEAIAFQYETKFFDLGTIGTAKRFNKIIVWTEDSSDGELTIDYWTQYKSGSDEQTTQTAPITLQSSESLWDLGYWDSSYWDNTVKAYNPVVFNLSSPKNSSEGDCIKIRIRQEDSDTPCTIAGFSILYTIAGLRK